MPLNLITTPTLIADDTSENPLFARVANDIERQGYSVQPAAFPESLAAQLYAHQLSISDAQFKLAGIGRQQDLTKNTFVRTDKICWIDGCSLAGQQWLSWAAQLQRFLNQRLFLGLFSFESHFAHYRPGDFYKRHYDAFKGEANRTLSIVLYLNSGWLPSDGGELALYRDEQDREGLHVVPLMGTLVVFLSEVFPHEVLPAQRDRYSIAGWYRVNTSQPDRVDPPR